MLNDTFVESGIRNPQIKSKYPRINPLLFGVLFARIRIRPKFRWFASHMFNITRRNFLPDLEANSSGRNVTKLRRNSNIFMKLGGLIFCFFIYSNASFLRNAMPWSKLISFKNTFRPFRRFQAF